MVYSFARLPAVADGELHSTLAVIFDHLVLPLPAPGSAADHARPGSAALAEFLIAEAVTLTPAAQCYLAGTSDAGPGLQSLAARHAAGWRAVLDPDPDWVTLELPTLEHPAQLDALRDITRLEAHLSGGSAPREPRARGEPW